MRQPGPEPSTPELEARVDKSVSMLDSVLRMGERFMQAVTSTSPFGEDSASLTTTDSDQMAAMEPNFEQGEALYEKRVQEDLPNPRDEAQRMGQGQQRQNEERDDANTSNRTTTHPQEMFLGRRLRETSSSGAEFDENRSNTSSEESPTEGSHVSATDFIKTSNEDDEVSARHAHTTTTTATVLAMSGHPTTPSTRAAARLSTFTFGGTETVHLHTLQPLTNIPKLHGRFAMPSADRDVVVEDWIKFEEEHVDDERILNREIFFITDPRSRTMFNTAMGEGTWEARYKTIKEQHLAAQAELLATPVVLSESQTKSEVEEVAAVFFGGRTYPPGTQGATAELLKNVSNFHGGLGRHVGILETYKEDVASGRPEHWASKNAFESIEARAPEYLLKGFLAPHQGVAPKRSVVGFRDWLQALVNKFSAEAVDRMVSASMHAAASMAQASAASTSAKPSTKASARPSKLPSSVERKPTSSATAGGAPATFVAHTSESFRNALPVLTPLSSAQAVWDECRAHAAGHKRCMACGEQFFHGHNAVCTASSAHKEAKAYMTRIWRKGQTGSAVLLLAPTSGTPTASRPIFHCLALGVGQHSDKAKRIEIFCDTGCDTGSTLIDGFCGQTAYEQHVRDGVAEPISPLPNFMVKGGDASPLLWTIVGQGRVHMALTKGDGSTVHLMATLAIVAAADVTNLTRPMLGHSWLGKHGLGLPIRDTISSTGTATVLALEAERFTAQREELEEPHKARAQREAAEAAKPPKQLAYNHFATKSKTNDKERDADKDPETSSELRAVLRPSNAERAGPAGGPLPVYLDHDGTAWSAVEEEMCLPLAATTASTQEERDDRIAKAIQSLSDEGRAVAGDAIKNSRYVNDSLPSQPALGYVATDRRDMSIELPFAGRDNTRAMPKAHVQAVLEHLQSSGIFVEVFPVDVQTARCLASFPHVVESAGKLRIVLDMRNANKATQGQGAHIDRIETQLASMVGMGEFLLQADVAKAYFTIRLLDPDQLALVQFKGKYYASQRVATGGKNSMTHLHNAMEIWFADLLGGKWGKFADNLFCAAKTEHDIVNDLLQLLACCERFQVTINIKDLVVGARRITLLGYELGTFDDGKRGYRKGPQALVNVMQVPAIHTMADVARVYHLGIYGGTQVTGTLELVEPLRELLRGKPSALKPLGKIKVSEEQRVIAEAARAALQATLQQQLVVTVFEPRYPVIIITDASDTLFGAVVVQHPREQLELPLFERDLTVITVKHAAWSATDTGKHIHELELEAARRTVESIFPLIRGSAGPLFIYTDSTTVVSKYRNVFLSEQARSRVGRTLTMFNHLRVKMVHLPGALNQVADQLSRTPPTELSMAPTQVVELTPIVALVRVAAGEAQAGGTQAPNVTTRRAAQAKQDTSRRLDADCFETLLSERNEQANLHGISPRSIWHNSFPATTLAPSIVSQLKEASKQDKREREGDKWVDGIWVRIVNHTSVWVVPREAVDLQHAIWLVCHETGGIHPAAEGTIDCLQRFVTFEGMGEKVKRWTGNCLVCKTSNPERRRIQYGINRTGLGPFDLVAMDFCDMGATSPDGYRYALVMCDVYSRHVWATPTRTMTASETGHHLIDYSAHYLQPRAYVSDQGSAFIAESTRQMAKIMGFNQHFTVAEVCFTRGLIESGVKGVKHALLKLFASLGKSPRDFPDLLGLACSLHNNTVTSTPSMAGYSPNEIAFGQDRPPAMVIFRADIERVEHVSLTPDIKKHVAEMGDSLAVIHRGLLEKRRKLGLDAPPARGQLRNEFAIGDAVLVAVDERPNACTPRWDSPSKVTALTSPRSVVIEDLVTKVKTERHVSELRQLGQGRADFTLTEWELIFHGAMAKHEVHAITEFKLDKSKGLMAKFEFGRAQAAPLWKVAREWITKVPLLFNVLLETDLCSDPKVFDALEELLVKHGVRERTTVPPENGATAQDKKQKKTG